jgi:hypothetical protein
LAVIDVFWPFSVLAAAVIGLAWWKLGFAALWAAASPAYMAGYFGIGFIWVFFRWTRLVEKELKDQRQRKAELHPPVWSGHSDDFIAYFFYWPVDAVAYFLSEFLQEVWDFISTFVGKSFNRYAQWRFKASQSIDGKSFKDYEAK